MCILISTTGHPDYPVILLSNRDEFFARPTQLASSRKLTNGANIISPLDLGRDERGTWIGVTSEGRVAILLNYREDTCVVSKVSRGILPIEYLSSSLEDDQWYNSLEESLAKSNLLARAPVNLEDIGGFTLIYGKLSVDSVGELVPLNIISNRGDRGKIHDSDNYQNGEAHQKIAKQKFFSVSNALYYEPWPKTELATKKLSEVVESAVSGSYTQEELVEACFGVLSIDSYNPEIRGKSGALRESKLAELRNSIFIPPISTATSIENEASSGSSNRNYYGTRTQTVIMYHRSGDLHYYERDLYDGDMMIQNFRNQHFIIHLKQPGVQEAGV